MYVFELGILRNLLDLPLDGLVRMQITPERVRYKMQDDHNLFMVELECEVRSCVPGVFRPVVSTKELTTIIDESKNSVTLSCDHESVFLGEVRIDIIKNTPYYSMNSLGKCDGSVRMSHTEFHRIVTTHIIACALNDPLLSIKLSEKKLVFETCTPDGWVARTSVDMGEGRGSVSVSLWYLKLALQKIVGSDLIELKFHQAGLVLEVGFVRFFFRTLLSVDMFAYF